MQIEEFHNHTFTPIPPPYPEFTLVQDIVAFISERTSAPTEDITVVCNGDVLDPTTPVASLPTPAKVRFVVSRSTFSLETLTPEQGYTAGGTLVRLVGVFPNPTAAYTARFGTVDVAAQYWDETTISARTPPHPAGPVSVMLKAGNGRFVGDGVVFNYVDRLVDRSMPTMNNAGRATFRPQGNHSVSLAPDKL